MADEVPDDTSPLGLKRRMNELVPVSFSLPGEHVRHLNPHDTTNQRHSLALSVPDAVNGSPEISFSEEQTLTCSPKKSKHNPQQQQEALAAHRHSEELWNLDSNSEFDRNEAIGECLDLGCGGSCDNFYENQSFAVEIPENLEGDALTCSLKIQVIDGTAVLDVSKIDDRKRPKRKGSKNGNSNLVVVAGASNGGKRKFSYSRKEMQALRFLNVKGQKKFWQKIYNGFVETVKKEYDELGSFSQPHKNRRNRNGPGILENINSTDFACDGDDNGENDVLAEEFSEEEESDDEYESIQRPAFLVEGEPDFDSGPPEDGLEYLRRVRWEAAQIPKVKVAKLDKSKLNEQQSVYMPKIPDIENCPPHLAPLRQWEDEFVAKFSELRLALSHLEATINSPTVNPQSIIFGPGEQTSRSSQSLTSLELPSGGPNLSTILAMDPVTRVAMLKRRISLFDSTREVSKDDCAWLFALCAVVATPLDADTCASLRCLLRRCAKLRAAKSELDDEVVMLNVLVTISGKFFGQSED